jgi:cell division protein FtsI/penicillin-binding protein 2
MRQDHLQREPIRRSAVTRIVFESAFVFGVLFLIPQSPTQPAGSAAPGIFSQAAKASLDRNFPSPAISYLLMDNSGAVLAERWPAAMDSDLSSASSPSTSHQAIAPGSLVKPFLATAYGDQHGGKFPIVRCTGTSSHCWLPSGHGSLGLEEAIAQSCNTYFLELAAGLDRGRAAQTFSRFGLDGPDPGAPDGAFIGLGNEWKESPIALAKAYLQLEKELQSPVLSRIVKGMLGSAERGTARGVDAELGSDMALAKTGTAPCSHKPAGAADGFTVVLYPADQPRLLLLVRVHNATGAASAKVAGAMLRSLGVSLR